MDGYWRELVFSYRYDDDDEETFLAVVAFCPPPLARRSNVYE